MSFIIKHYTNLRLYL